MTSSPSSFAPLPDFPRLGAAWPTPNHALFEAPARFLASTRANPDYGRPGWTRDCGRRFHRGCDIAPVHAEPTGLQTSVEFTDCRTGDNYSSMEPTYTARDPVFSVFAGHVREAIAEESESDFGLHVVVEHTWSDGSKFFTVYGHLSELRVHAGDTVQTGQSLGRMGATSRSADARNWLSIAPHLHFEVWNDKAQAVDPVAFLQRHLAR